MSNGPLQVAVMGAKAIAEPFKAVGAKVFAIDTAKAAEVFKEVVASGLYPLVFLSAEVAAALPHEIRTERRRGVVALSVLPSPGAGSDQSAAMFLKEMAERALGMDILK